MVFSRSPVALTRRLSRTAVSYERATFAFLAVGGPGDENTLSVLDQVVHVRDGLHRYAAWLERVADTDHPVLCDLDPEPIPPVALDHTWGAVIGLVTNIHLLAAVIASFPTDRWHHHGVLNGNSVSALELANYGVHEAVHHLGDLAGATTVRVSSSGNPPAGTSADEARKGRRPVRPQPWLRKPESGSVFDAR